MTRVLGIEGTAWCASSAVFDSGQNTILVESDEYQPDSGGIHPREAAEHMRSAIPNVINTTIETVTEEYGQPRQSLDAIAFSQGPGLGPCLRITATAARSLAGTLDLPLAGVNHMVAHLEIGRYRSGYASPICLNASGANAHLLGYHKGRYRILGETMDTGVGNALDKFTRYVGWSHPGGPKVETQAKNGEYIPLPYIVKGMDFSFSGITSAAKQAYDDGHPVEDICRGLEETIFAMLVEVSERALSLTGTGTLILGGGVGQNQRLREMLATMCDARNADFYAPEPRFLRDNAGMIAVLGALMFDAGDTVPIEDSQVRPNFRPDEVSVTWRPDEAMSHPPTDPEQVQGAEAIVDLNPDTDRVHKRRVTKEYRHPDLDATLRARRTRSEARLTSEARQVGVPTPIVFDVNPSDGHIEFEYVGDRDLRDRLSTDGVSDLARHLACCHDEGFVHGDPTPRNVRIAPDFTYCIDFGLGYYTDDIEDFAMDLHLFERALEGTAETAEPLLDAFEAAYRDVGDGQVIDQLREIEGRGRYQ